MSDDKKEKLKVPSFINRMMETYAEWQWVSITRCFFLAQRDERKARLQAIMELSVELAKIKEVTIQSSAFAEQAIEAIIEGDWGRAGEYVGYLSFEDERGHEEFYKRMNSLYEKFRATLMAACTLAKQREAGTPLLKN